MPTLTPQTTPTDRQSYGSPRPVVSGIRIYTWSWCLRGAFIYIYIYIYILLPLWREWWRECPRCDVGWEKVLVDNQAREDPLVSVSGLWFWLSPQLTVQSSSLDIQWSLIHLDLLVSFPFVVRFCIWWPTSWCAGNCPCSPILLLSVASRSRLHCVKTDPKLEPTLSWNPGWWPEISQTLHVWHICIHWGGLRGQCRHIYIYI